MTGATVDAATALNWGLVDVMTTAEQLDAEVEEALWSEILECGAEAIAAQKVLIRKWEELPLKGGHRRLDPDLRPLVPDSASRSTTWQKFIDRPTDGRRGQGSCDSELRTPHVRGAARAER